MPDSAQLKTGYISQYSVGALANHAMTGKLLRDPRETVTNTASIRIVTRSLAMAIPLFCGPLGLAAQATHAATSPLWYWQRDTADLVLLNGHVVTMDEHEPEAQAVAVAGERILAVGSDVAIQRYISPSTRVIDLGGRLLAPGFIDAHAHFMGIGRSLKQLDLTKAHTWDDIVSMVAAAVQKAKPGTWIEGHGWHQAKWDRVPQPNVGDLPYNDSLSRVSPDNPVILTHASGHGIFVNAKAMAVAGIGPTTPNPPGGEIVRDKNGRAIGMLRDRAAGLVGRVLQEQLDKRTPADIEADEAETVRLAAHDLASKGVTTASDQGESFQTIDFLRKQVSAGKVPVRLWVLVNGESPASLAAKLPSYWLDGYGNDHLSVRAIGETTADGALGTHSAWFLQPYADDQSATGLNVTPIATIRQMAEIALEDHFQVSVHAIGDRANHEVLNLFEEIFRVHPEARDLRWRIEHAQHLAATDIPRFAQLHVIASMQAVHACSDGPYVVQRLGQARAAKGAYVWRKLMASGAIIANGTDAPVEDIDPIPNFDCAVTRRMKNGQTFFPDQRMTREEALRSYTLNAAYAIFQEDRLGSITPGKLADLVIISKDIMTVPAEDIRTANVDDTFVGGQLIYERK